MKIVKDASLILTFHTCGPWGMEVPFITIRSVGEGYKNWTVGMWQKGGRESPVCDGFRPVMRN